MTDFDGRRSQGALPLITLILLVGLALTGMLWGQPLLPPPDDPTTPIVDAGTRYDVAVETLRDRTRTLATCQSALHIALVEHQRGTRIRSLAGTLLYAKGEEDSAERELAEAERVLAQALLAAREGG